MSASKSFDLSEVTKPVNVARGLPNAHYIDDAVFEEERQAVLFNNWSGVGFAKDVPEKGDAMPVDFIDMPLLILRDQDGDVRVYQNTCRHRGMILVSEKSNIRGTIRCPYHSWCYGLDGALRSTPHAGGPGVNIHEDIKRNELGLIEISSHIYMGVVFVNVSGKAAPFEEAHADLLERWKDFDQPMLHSGVDSSFKLDVNCNWKLAVENYCESYHLPWVHPGLNSYSRLEDHYHLEERHKYSGQGTLVYRQIEGQNDQLFPDFENLSEKWDKGGEYVAVYPNVLLGVQRDHAYAIILEPKAKEKTVEHVEIFYANKTAVGDSFSDLREKNAELWKGVFLEDVFVVEGMQKGRHGIFFDGGKFAPVMDSPTHMFHEWVANQINMVRQVAAE
jgi:phenylpropionate dioxygenase-like ring-hydroxylating dioxygenase large terminal subunit